MLFIHTSDLHFGGSRVIPNYLQRQEEVFDSIFDIAYDRNIEVVVIAGDIFDHSVPSQEERELVERKILEYDSAGFQLLIIPGNHDVIDATGYTAIRYLSMLYQHGRLINSVITEETCYVTVADTVFCLMVHGRGKFAQEYSDCVTNFFTSSLDLPDTKFVVVAHETIRGSQSEIVMSDGSGYVLESGEDVPASNFPVTYLALGDLHMKQKVSDNAFYCGSPLQFKFGENWPKGLLIVDTDDPENPEFVPISSNQMIKAKVGDIIPSNSHVKLLAASKEEAASAMKDNVVKIEIVKDTTTLSLDVNKSLKDKLMDAVKQQGASKSDLSLAKAEIESLIRQAD